MPTGNQEYIRDMNRSLVLEAIVNHAPISRADLSKMLHLTKATISNIVQELIDRELVLEVGSGDAPMGRKPILLTFHNRCGYVVSVDFGVKRTAIMTSDPLGRSCEVHEYPSQTNQPLMEHLIALLHQTISALPDSPYGVLSISVGIYGVVCDDTVLFTPYYDLKYSNIRNLLEEEFHVPVIVENEANLSVIGESAFGQNYRNMIFLNIHEGVGMGILVNGQLYKGQNGYAGEFGHTILFPDGRPCPCGNKGCLEQYISESAVLKEFANGHGKSSATIDEFLWACSQEDPSAQKALHDFIHYTAVSLNTILHTFNPDIIILNSSFTNYIPGLLDQITASVQNRLRWYLHVVPSQLQDVSVLLGGVCMCTTRFLGIRELHLHRNSSAQVCAHTAQTVRT